MQRQNPPPIDLRSKDGPLQNLQVAGNLTDGSAKFPPLDAPYIEGKTIAQHADALHLTRSPFAPGLSAPHVPEKQPEEQAPPQPAPQPAPAEAKSKDEQLKDAIHALDEFDYGAFQRLMQQDQLNTPQQRHIIEERLKPLDITDLIISGFVRQEVPIIPGKFEPTFCSLRGEDEASIKEHILRKYRNTATPEHDDILVDQHSIMVLAAMLVSIRSGENARMLATARKPDGSLDMGELVVKAAALLKYPQHMLGSLGIHARWFDIRVRSLFRVEAIKNG